MCGRVVIGRECGGEWGGQKKKKCRCICFDQIWPGGSIRKIFITCALGKVLSTNSVEGVEGVEGGGQGDGGTRCRVPVGPARPDGPERVAESIAADASQINTKVSQKAVKLGDGSRPAALANLIPESGVAEVAQ